MPLRSICPRIWCLVYAITFLHMPASGEDHVRASALGFEWVQVTSGMGHAEGCRAAGLVP